MKEEKIFEGITDIREDIIERAEAYVFPGEAESAEVPKEIQRKLRTTNQVWLTIGVVAACLVLVVVSPFVYMATRKCGSPSPESVGAAPGSTRAPGDSGQTENSQAEKGNPGDMTSETSIAMENVWIYYVEAGEICREEHFVKLQPADIFELWKEKNGIGAEVQLLDCELRSNATTEQVGEVVIHTVGDFFALYLTMSKNLEDYYGQTDEALLLASLEQTMTGYSGLTYQEYHLILE